MSRKYQNSPLDPKELNKPPIPALPYYYRPHYGDQKPARSIYTKYPSHTDISRRQISRKSSAPNVKFGLCNEPDSAYYRHPAVITNDYSKTYPQITLRIITPAISLPYTSNGYGIENIARPASNSYASSSINLQNSGPANFRTHGQSSEPRNRCEICCRHQTKLNDMFEKDMYDIHKYNYSQQHEILRNPAGGQLVEFQADLPTNTSLPAGVFTNSFGNQNVIQGPNERIFQQNPLITKHCPNVPKPFSKIQPFQAQEDVCTRPNTSQPSNSSPSLKNEVSLYSLTALENRLMKLQHSQDLITEARLLLETLEKIKPPEDIEQACELIFKGTQSEGGCCDGGKKVDGTSDGADLPKVCKAKSNLTEVLNVIMKGVENIVQSLKQATVTPDMIVLPENADESNRMLAKRLLGSQENIEQVRKQLESLLKEIQKVLSTYV